MKGEKTFFSARNVTFLAVLVALVVVLQVFGGYFKIGATSLSFVLVPIVLGGLLVGVWAGGLLGLLFGLITLVYGITGADGADCKYRVVYFGCFLYDGYYFRTCGRSVGRIFSFYRMCGSKFPYRGRY